MQNVQRREQSTTAPPVSRQREWASLLSISGTRVKRIRPSALQHVMLYFGEVSKDFFVFTVSAEETSY